MSDAPIKDPIFHEDIHLTRVEREAQGMEINEKTCRVCTRRIELSDGGVLCGVRKKWPDCRRDKNRGFQLDA